VDEDVGVLEFGHHLLGVGDEIGRQVGLSSRALRQPLRERMITPLKLSPGPRNVGNRHARLYGILIGRQIIRIEILRNSDLAMSAE
jgi:hypothetical protein